MKGSRRPRSSSPASARAKRLDHRSSARRRRLRRRRARSAGSRIVYAIETHVHADFVSRRARARGGRRAVARRTRRAPSLTRITKRTTASGSRVGDVALDVPAHAGTHARARFASSCSEPDEPPRLFTGDTLFVGAVGRPDLLGDEQTRQLANELYDSLFNKLLALDDRDRGASGPWRGIALRRRHRQGTVLDDRAGAPRSTRCCSTHRRTASSPRCWRICPRHRRISRG